MNKKFIKLLVILSLMPLSALECKKEVFVPAYNTISKVLELLDKTAVTRKTLNSLKTVKISKKNYSQEMKVLQDKLSMLHQKEKYGIEAQKINDKNIKIWIALEKSCQGDDSLAAKKVKNDLMDLKKDIKKRISTINHYIRLTQMGIKMGEKRYAPNKQQ